MKPHNLSPCSCLKQWTQLIACWDLLLSQVWGDVQRFIRFWLPGGTTPTIWHVLLYWCLPKKFSQPFLWWWELSFIWSCFLWPKLYLFLISFHTESSRWFLLSLKRGGIPGKVEGSYLPASHGFSQLVLLHNQGKDGKEQCCHEEGASQW